MPHDHCLTPAPKPFCGQHPVTCWPEAPRGERQQCLANLENRVGLVALSQTPGVLCPFPGESLALKASAVVETVDQELPPSCPGALSAVFSYFTPRKSCGAC